jgi:tetratricopeptide (TPR) repeat protein
MGFRDDFINAYVMTPVGSRERTFPQWPPEKTADNGLRVTQKEAQFLREQLASAFKAGISHLAGSQAPSAKLLERELQYQIEHMVEAIGDGPADVVASIQRACDYLGGPLVEIRWAIEKQTQASQQALDALLGPSESTSRRYFNQGVRLYEDFKYDLAGEAFRHALNENSRNYFAHQYLGFTAVNRNEPEQALTHFDLARRAAETDYHKALALSHLARGYEALGRFAAAIQAAQNAAKLVPDRGTSWYECAIYSFQSGATDQAVDFLRKAIETDSVYWSISIADSNLEPMRRRVEKLLENVRQEQRSFARACLDRFQRTLATLGGMRISAELSEHAEALQGCEVWYREGTVFAFHNLVLPAQQAEKAALQVSLKVLDKRIEANRAELLSAEKQQGRAVDELSSRIKNLEEHVRSKERPHEASGLHGCLIAVGGVAGAFFLFAYAVNTGLDRTLIGQMLAGSGIVLLAGLLWAPVMRFVRWLPLATITSQLSTLRRKLETVKQQSEARLKTETARLNAELKELNQRKLMCQSLARAQLVAQVYRNTQRA